MKKALLSTVAATMILGLAACGNETTEGKADETTAAETAEVASNELLVIEAAKRPVFVGVDGGNVAVSGYDVTSYFTADGTPAKGSEEFAVQYGDAVYHFASAENKEKFIADPAAFVPQYGGHCAWAMASGKLAPGDPTLAKIVDGKLYLNFNTDVQKDWNSDIPGYLEKSEAAWPTIPDDKALGDS